MRLREREDRKEQERVAHRQIRIENVRLNRCLKIFGKVSDSLESEV